MIEVGIVGPTGYVGGGLTGLLPQRGNIEIERYGSKSYADQKYALIYQNMFQIVDDAYIDDNMKELVNQVGVVLMVTSQGLCAFLIDEEVLPKVRMIDLSADFRIKDANVYGEWYKIKHPTPKHIEEAVYRLPEINREKIETARLIANPGCYPTCSALAIYPLVKEGLIDTNTIIIDAKSGVSDAGGGTRVDNLYYEVNEGCKAYDVAGHRHMPEIEEQLSYAARKPATLNFTPHLIPMNWGILITACATLAKTVSYDETKAIYDKYYAGEQFVRVSEKDVIPQTRWVEGGNFMDVSFKIDIRTNRAVMMGAIDSVAKGAIGQAAQDMNLQSELSESTELGQVLLFP